MSRRSSRMHPRPTRGPRRRGVILLVVLSVLALFTLLVLTFVIYTTQHRKTAAAAAKADRYDDAYADLLNRAMMQVIRGSDNPTSIIGIHSLLEDMYGNDWITGTLLPGGGGIPTTFTLNYEVGYDAGSGNGVPSMMYFIVPLVGADGGAGRAGIDDDGTNGADDAAELGFVGSDDYKLTPGYYNGRVLSMIDGPAAGQTTRITGYSVDLAAGTAVIVMMPFETMSNNGVSWNLGGAPLSGNSFVINGRPFSGTGFGFIERAGTAYDPPSVAAVQIPGSVRATEPSSGRPYALLPFPPSSLPDPTSPYATAYTDYLAYISGADGQLGTRDDRVNANEDYDAPDYNNMLLAGRVWTGSGYEVALPSLVRPDLMHYWRVQAPASFTGSDASRSEILRRIFPRPLRMANTANLGNALFDGSNAQMNNGLDDRTQDSVYWSDLDSDGVIDIMNSRAWDVDNDGDGRMDSVWTDFGFPIQTAPDGRRYKPLVAVLCLDMDGRLNINAHGTNYHFAVNTSTGNEYYVGLNQLPGSFAGGQGYTAAVPMSTGLGASVAEVSLGQSIAPTIVSTPYLAPGDGTTVIDEYRRLLMGGFPWDPGLQNVNTGRPLLEGRYGEGFLYYDTTNPGRLPMPGITSLPQPLGNGFDGTLNTLDDVFEGDTNFPPSAMGYVVSPTPSGFRGDAYANTYYPNGTSGAVGNMGSPLDIDGNGVMGLDLLGNPFYVFMGGVNAGLPGYTVAPLGEAYGDPTEIDLSRKALRTRTNTATGEVGTIDNPFSPADMESFLRRRDKDARTLPDRLVKLAPRTFNGDRGTGSLTTESWSVPTPTVTLPEELRRYLVANGFNIPTNLHLNDLYALKLLQGGITTANINNNLAIMLPADLVAGLRLDINRPLGNGLDDARADGVDLDGDGNAANDGNGVVDEPAEALLGETLWAGSAVGPVVLNHSNDNIPANRYLARQQLARQLYCLMMLLKDSGYVEPVDPAEGLTDAQKVEVTARRIAQWAINVVDYRDRDSIMTPFEYDVFPFTDGSTTPDGIAWDVDGWVGYNTATGAASLDDNDLTTYPHRRLVWGCEQPDLLLTESLAMHDVRTQNTSAGGTRDTMGNGDDDLDSQLLPRGSAFFELYCPRNVNNTAFAGDLYRSNGYLDLGKMAPSNGTTAYPVWRLAISWGRFDESGGPGASNAMAGPQNDVATTAITRPNTTTFQPEDMNFLSTANIPSAAYTVPSGETAAAPLASTNTNINIERIVWFASVRPTPGTTVDADRIYYNCGPGVAGTGDNVLLGPGQYAVVGPYVSTGGSDPDNITTVGPSATGSVAAEVWLGNAAAPNLPDGTSNAGCRVPVKVTNIGGADNYPVAGTAIQTPLGIAVAGDPTGTANAAFGSRIGLSISEPLFSDANYYPKPDSSTTTNVEHYDGSDSDFTDQFTTGVDVPYDHDASRPLGQNSMYQYGTKDRYKTVFLQRLADPTQPWNPSPRNPDGTANTNYNGNLPLNPYLTVDWMPIDLTVFNGESVTPAGVTDPDDVGAANRFGTRQRGFPRTPAAAGGNYNLWEQPRVSIAGWTAASAVTRPPTGSPLSNNPNTTLGYINLPFTLPSTGMGYVAPGYLTSTNMATLAPSYPTANYIGGPAGAQVAINGVTYPTGITFPSLAWNNRPYASSLEVLQVPASSPGRLLHEYCFGGTREYAGPAPGAPGDGAAFVEGTANGRPFGHLLNMFTSSNDLPAPTYVPTDKTLARSNYHRILDFLTVPSRFSGTKDPLNPAAVWETGAGSLPFHPPFNEVSRYREPGRVNINTIMDDGAIFRGIMNDYPGAASMWLAMMQSRRGYGGVVAAPIQALSFEANGNSPTIFANPFRSYGSGYNVPWPSLRYRNADPSGTTFLPRDLTEAGLLRPVPADTDINNFNPPFRPLFANNPGFTALLTADNTFTTPPVNATRNPMFRYQPLQKLDNVLTTQSNVYAIWITVGYFEVTPWATSATHPDGAQLGSELRADTGDIKRHRAFYLFDRSIPVAFQRGFDHNVDKALLVRRIIE